MQNKQNKANKFSAKAEENHINYLAQNAAKKASKQAKQTAHTVHVASKSKLNVRGKTVHTTSNSPLPNKRFAPFFALGNAFYQLGFATEYHLVKLYRIVRNFFAFFAQIMLLLFTNLQRLLAGFLKSIWQDIKEPFSQIKRQKRHAELLQQIAIKSGEDKGDLPSFFGFKLKRFLALASAVLGLLLPFAAAAVFFVTVRQLTSMQYALAVEINGTIMGYVADQTVVDSAKTILMARIKVAENQQISDWQLQPSYSIARVDSYTTTQQLVNKILRTSSKNPADIVSATGLYIGRELFAVTDDGKALKEYLDNYLQEKAQQAQEGAVVSFVNVVECDPESEDVFFATSVLSWDEMQQKLQEDIAPARYVVANGQKSLSEIAAENGVAQDVLLLRNPEFADLGLDYVPLAGKSIKLTNAVPRLQVKTVFRMQSTEEIPFETKEQPRDDRAFGTRRALQQGVVGLQEVFDDYVYIDGELSQKIRVDELTKTLQPPVDKIVEVGTNSQTSAGLNDYIFPVPSSVRSSRGISSYHRGLDINAPTGEPIFACKGGAITTSGWHYSYGYYIIIDHGDGMSTLYAHNSQLFVEAGRQVEQGELIAAVGSTGNSSGPHLHLEFLLNGTLQNPLNYISPPPGYLFGRG